MSKRVNYTLPGQKTNGFAACGEECELGGQIAPQQQFVKKDWDAIEIPAIHSFPEKTAFIDASAVFQGTPE